MTERNFEKMAKGDKFYFENFAESTAFSKEAATYLVSCLENYEPENIEQMLKRSSPLWTGRIWICSAASWTM